jgi:hypothetical protein
MFLMTGDGLLTTGLKERVCMESVKNIPYSLSPSGNCPVCKKNVKYVAEGYTIFKSKPVLIYKDRIETKCPNCSHPLVDKY